MLYQYNVKIDSTGKVTERIGNYYSSGTEITPYQRKVICRTNIINDNCYDLIEWEEPDGSHTQQQQQQLTIDAKNKI